MGGVEDFIFGGAEVIDPTAQKNKITLQQSTVMIVICCVLSFSSIISL